MEDVYKNIKKRRLELGMTLPPICPYKENIMIGVYKITNIKNGKVYIGQSVDIDKRFKAHKNCFVITTILTIACKTIGILTAKMLLHLKFLKNVVRCI